MKIIAALFMLAFSIQATAQTAHGLSGPKVPVAVANEFTKTFPASKPVWTVTRDRATAKFKAHNGSKAFAEFSLDGHLKNSGMVIDHYDIPTPAVMVVNKKYPEGTIMEGARIVDESGDVFYRISGTQGKSKYTVYCDYDGNIVHKK